MVMAVGDGVYVLRPPVLPPSPEKTIVLNPGDEIYAFWGEIQQAYKRAVNSGRSLSIVVAEIVAACCEPPP